MPLSNKKYHINHIGKTLYTNDYIKLSKKKCEEIRKLYYEKPAFIEVSKNMKTILKGGTKITKIEKYYFKHLMAKVKFDKTKWTIEEALQSDQLIGYFYSRILKDNVFFPPERSLITNFETCLRLSSGSVVRKPSNFPLKVANKILNKYNVNNNYYDFSCGWGVRLLSSIINKINYYGTDPNYLLVDSLNKLHNDMKGLAPIIKADIKCQGSEILVDDWKNKMGLIFSSPPLF
jgi:hypothetical protein